MVEHNFPSASFGKPAGAIAYQIIEQHPAFEQADIAAAFRTICTSFEWKPAMGEDTHAPCYGAIQCGDVTLIARYTDAGRDSSGRPHTLQVDCLLAPQEDAEKAWAVFGREPTALDAISALKIIGDTSTFTQATFH